MIPYGTHKIIFTISDILALYTWAVIYLIAWVLAGYFVYRIALKRKDLDVNSTLQTVILALIGVMIGARAFHFFGPWGYGTIKERLFSMFWFTPGWVAYGGIIGAFILTFIFMKVKKIDFMKYADFFSPAVVLGLFIGRFGCFIAGDDFGTRTLLPWAINFNGNLIHPTQLYHALANLIVFVIALEIYRRSRIRKMYKGNVFYCTFFLYAVFRFFVEYLRAYPSNVFYFGMTFSQVVSLAFIIIFGALLVYNHRESKLKKITLDRTAKKSYLLIFFGGLLSIISTLFINASFYPLLILALAGGIILAKGIKAYTGSRIIQ